jgi:hypothetical protein
LTFFPRSQERIGEVKGDFQGGSIDILTYEEVAVADKAITMSEINRNPKNVIFRAVEC